MSETPGVPPGEPRPPTAAGILEYVVTWLNAIDDKLEQFYRQTGREIPEGMVGRSVQGDLLMFIEWLKQHPEVDAQMYSVLGTITREDE